MSEQKNKTAISELERSIRENEMHMASIQDEINDFGIRIQQFTDKRNEKTKLFNSLGEATAELNEAIHILKGD